MCFLLFPYRLSISKIENFSAVEKFQNDVLRPIIKLQHDLLLSYFEEYLKRNKIIINELEQIRMKGLIQKLFKTNNRLKIELRGLIIGLFTIDEFKEYSSQSSNLNKRINNIIEQRINSFYFS